jgi:hypothetical protein
VGLTPARAIDGYMQMANPRRNVECGRAKNLLNLRVFSPKLDIRDSTRQSVGLRRILGVAASNWRPNSPGFRGELRVAAD